MKIDNVTVMEIKPLLSEEQQKEIDLISQMSYKEVKRLSKKIPICEGKSILDNAQYVDMSLEEFMQTYNLEDITSEIKKYV